MPLGRPDTDAHIHDEQTAWEKAITGLAICLGGADLMLNPGMFSSGLIVSYEQLVIDNEILGYINRVVRGMRASSDTLVVDLVRKVGHGGQFLKEAHTLKEFRSEYWIPDISSRAAFGRWTHKSGQDIVKSAKGESSTAPRRSSSARAFLHHKRGTEADRQGFRDESLSPSCAVGHPDPTKPPTS